LHALGHVSSTDSYYALMASEVALWSDERPSSSSNSAFAERYCSMP